MSINIENIRHKGGQTMLKNIYDMSNTEICDTILQLAQNKKIPIDKIGLAKSGSIFVVIESDNTDLLKLNDFTIELDSVFLGANDTKGNIVRNESELLAKGYESAVVFGCNNYTEFCKYLGIVSASEPHIIYKGGAMLES